MRKINCLKRIFILLILIALTIPSLSAWTGGGSSFLKEPQSFRVDVDPIKRPKLFKEFKTGRFQAEWTYWFNYYFYLRGFFVRLRSSLFYLANFKRFFLPSVIHLSSFKNRVVEVDEHNQYKRTIDGHRMAYGAPWISFVQIRQTAEKLKYIQQELNKRGKGFLLISGYSGWREVYGDKISPYYRFFDNYYQNNSDKMRAEFNDYLNKAGINFFNTHPFLANIAKTTGIDTVSYYDSHWNRYGAGRVVVESLKHIKSIYKTEWELPQVKSVEISTTPTDMETEGLGRARMFHSLENSFMQKRLIFPYIVYEAPKKKNEVKVILLGDSYVEPYEMQLKATQFTDEKNIEKYRDYGNIQADIDKVISQNDVIIVMFVEPNFYDIRLKRIVDVFYEYLNSK